jgi:hypothetical protein
LEYFWFPYLVDFVPDVDPFAVRSLTSWSDVQLSQRFCGGGIGEKVNSVLRRQTGGFGSPSAAFFLSEQVSVNGRSQLLLLFDGQMVGQVLQMVGVTAGQVFLVAEVVAAPDLAFLCLPPEKENKN